MIARFVRWWRDFERGFWSVWDPNQESERDK